MQTNTHAAAGLIVGSALTVTQPNEYFAIALASAFVGAVVSDIDVGDVGKKTTPVMVGLLCSFATAGVAAAGAFYIPNVTDIWRAQSNPVRSIIGALLFIAICLYGARQPHRSFMHSFIGLFSLSISVYLILPVAAVYFFAGFVSHMFLDVINYRPLLLNYPSQKGFSLKLCYSKSKLNTIMFGTGLVIFAGLLVFRFFKPL